MNAARPLIAAVALVLLQILSGPFLQAQVAAFLSPDTVCVNQPVSITNTSAGVSSCYWNFCSGNVVSDPAGINIGNPGNLLNIPGYITMVKDGGTCYSFITTHGSNRVVRYNHGASFNNNPVSWTNLGDFSMISDTVQGIKIRNDNGTWIGIVVDNTKIVRLNFGSSVGNTPTATMLGTYSLLYFAHGLDLFYEGGNWIGFVTCSWGNRLVRLNFGNSLLNSPVLTDLGTPGAMNMPTTFCIIKESGSWTGIVVNYGDNTLTRFSFGSSLLNPPDGVNLGNVCPSITAAGIALIRDCENTVGYQLNTSVTSPDLIWRLNFPSGITGPVTGTSLGNIGNLSQPLRFSELFRSGDTLFLYATNRLTPSLTRLRFLPCTNASVPSSGQYSPPSFSYSQPGTYNIQLIVNEGMPTQATVCKSIVVKACPVNLNAAFSAPDTVCVGMPVNILNQTVGGESFYWSFCTGDTLPNPLGSNIGNPGNMLNVPGYCTLVKDGNNCHSFITNQASKSVVRYSHGTSFNNKPVSWTNLGGFGLLSDTVMGIKIRYDNGQWIGIVNNNNRLVRLNFGTSLANTPSATLLGPYSMLYVARGLEIIKEGSTWLGFITSNQTNRMIRMDFGNSLLNAPVLTDLGPLGAMNNPAAFQFLKENGVWYCMVVNNGDNTITRLTFGNSLLNTPTGINTGTACPSLSPPGEISFIRDCQRITGFQLHYSSTSSDLIWRLRLPSGITGPLLGNSLGNIGSLARPNTFSELFRVGDTLFLYAVNRQNSTLTRLHFLSCSNAATASSDLYNPPAYSYSQPGTYQVQLIVNEGKPDQASLCKQIVVIARPAPVYIDTTLCAGTAWFAGGALQTQPGTYHDTIPNGGGCDSIIQTTLRYKPAIPVSLGKDTMFCNGPPIMLHTGVPGAGYLWPDGSTDSTYAVYSPGDYWVIVTKDGCTARDSIAIGECVSPLWFPNVFTPNGDGLNETFHPVGLGVTKYNIMIYDRWGLKIYESNEIEPGWDGRIKGEMCSDGVYMFIATYNLDESSGETYHANGSITLLR
jgi:gliding motility-associated-like protein